MPVQMSIQMNQERMRGESLLKNHFGILLFHCFRRKRRNDRRNQPSQLFEAAHKVLSLVPFRSELKRTVPLVALPAKLPTNVLSKISFDMKHKISCRIRDSRRCSP